MIGVAVMEDKPEEATKCSSQGVCKVVCAVILLTIGIVVGYNLNGSKSGNDKAENDRWQVTTSNSQFILLDKKTGETWLAADDTSFDVVMARQEWLPMTNGPSGD